MERVRVDNVFKFESSLFKEEGVKEVFSSNKRRLAMVLKKVKEFLRKFEEDMRMENFPDIGDDFNDLLGELKRCVKDDFIVLSYINKKTKFLDNLYVFKSSVSFFKKGIEGGGLDVPKSLLDKCFLSYDIFLDAFNNYVDLFNTFIL